jgi:hypothetical protein
MKLKLFALAGALVVALFTGCQSFTNTPGGTLTSVTITNQPMSAIMQATAAVFATHGFEGGQTGPGQFTFHRPGTRSNNLAYGNAMFDEVVTIRVVVLVKKLDAHSTFVGCNAWLIEAADDPVFEDSHQVRKLRKWPYEQLLQDIQTQLGQ